MSELIFCEPPTSDLPHNHQLRVGNSTVLTEFNLTSTPSPSAYLSFWQISELPVAIRLHVWQYRYARKWVAEHCTTPMYYQFVRNSAFGETRCGDGAFRCNQFAAALAEMRTHKFLVSEPAEQADRWLRDNAPRYCIHTQGTQTAIYIEDADAATAAALRFEHQPVVISG